MQKSKCNLKCKIITIVLSAILTIAVAGWFYRDFKGTQKSVVKVESKLAEDGFDKFYQKEGNRFCVSNAQTEQEQEAIMRDMVWILDNNDYRKIKEVNCGKGKGIEVK